MRAQKAPVKTYALTEITRDELLVLRIAMRKAIDESEFNEFSEDLKEEIQEMYNKLWRLG